MAAKTPLGAAISTTNGTSITVLDVLGFPSTGAYTVVVDSEWLRVTAGAGTTTWTVTRGYNGTTAATHLIAATVTLIDDEGEWTSASHMMDTLGLTTAAQLAVLEPCVDAANAEITRRVGRFLGPASETTRTYRRIEPDEGGRVLWIPGGIRSFTTIELRRTSLDAWETVTSGDVVVGPPSWDLRPGQPYAWVEFIDDPAGDWGSFPWHGEARFSGSLFGPEEVDADCARIAEMIAARMYQYSESGGDLTLPSASKFVYADDAAKLDAIRAEHLAGVS